MKRKWLIPTIGVIAVMSILFAIGVIGHFDYSSVIMVNSQEEKEETDNSSVNDISVDLFYRLGREIGICLEDGREDLAAEYASVMVQEYVVDHGIELNPNEREQMKEEMKNGFLRLVERGRIQTDGAGNCSEQTKSYVANMMVGCLETVCGQELLENLSVKRSQKAGNDVGNAVGDMAENAAGNMAGNTSDNQVGNREGIESMGVSPIQKEGDPATGTNRNGEIEKGYDPQKETDPEENLKTDVVLSEFIRIAELTRILTEWEEKWEIQFEEQYAEQIQEIPTLREDINAIKVLVLAMEKADQYVTKEELRFRLETQVESMSVIVEQLSAEQMTVMQGQNAKLQEEVLQWKEELRTEINQAVTELRSELQNICQVHDSQLEGILSQLNGLVIKQQGDGAEVQKSIEGIHTQLKMLRVQNQTEMEGLRGRLTDLEKELHRNMSVTTELLRQLIVRSEELNTDALRATLADKTGKLTDALTDLQRKMMKRKEELTEIEPDSSRIEKMEQIQEEINQTLDAVGAYSNAMLIRLNRLDERILTGKSSLGEMTAETQEEFVKAASELIGIQTAESVYFEALREKVSELASVVQEVDDTVRYLGLSDTWEKKLSLETAQLTAMVDQSKQEVRSELAGLQNQFQQFLSDMKKMQEEFQETEQEHENRLDRLEQNPTVVRVDGFVIQETDWIYEEQSGLHYFEVVREAFQNAYHAEVRYSGDPNIEPFYTSGEKSLFIWNACPVEVTVSEIFIYQKQETIPTEKNTEDTQKETMTEPTTEVQTEIQTEIQTEKQTETAIEVTGTATEEVSEADTRPENKEEGREPE